MIIYYLTTTAPVQEQEAKRRGIALRLTMVALCVALAFLIRKKRKELKKNDSADIPSSVHALLVAHIFGYHTRSSVHGGCHGECVDYAISDAPVLVTG